MAALQQNSNTSNSRRIFLFPTPPLFRYLTPLLPESPPYYYATRPTTLAITALPLSIARQEKDFTELNFPTFLFGA